MLNSVSALSSSWRTLLVCWAGVLVGLAQPQPDLREAARLDQAGRCEESEKIYQRALAQGVPGPALLNNTGNHYLACRQLDKARIYFERLLKAVPAHPNGNLQMARLEMASGEFASAETRLTLLVGTQPKDFELLLLLGRAAARAGHAAKARDTLESALLLRPDDPAATLEAGLANAAFGDYPRAVFLLARAQSRAPNQPAITLALARASEDAGYYGDALVAYNRFLTLVPNDNAARRDRARIAAFTGSRKELEEFVKQNPRDPLGHFYSAQIRWKDDAEGALASLAEAVKLDPKLASAHVARAWLLHRLGRSQDALPHLEAALRIAPNDFRALDQMGIVLLALDRPNDAVSALRKAVSIAPKDAAIALHLGRALIDQGKEAEGQFWLDAYQKLRPARQRDARRESGMIELATLDSAGQRTREIERFRQMARSRPDDPLLQLNLAGLLLDDGQREEALREYKILEGLNGGKEIWAHAGRTLADAGERDAAKLFLDKAGVQGAVTQDREAALAEAIALDRKGDTAAARQRLLLIRSKYPDWDRAWLPPQQQFVDVASKSRFDYVTRNGFSDRKYFPQPLCGGVAVLDFDNDGHQDLYFTNGARFPDLKKADASFHNTLLRNKGDGTFEDVTRRAGLAGEALGYSLGVAAADYDNDGWTDLFIASAGPNTLYRNKGDGTFEDVTASSGLTKPADTLSVQGAWLDYDNDGRLDLVLSNYTTWTPATDRRCVRSDGVEFYCHPKTYAAVPHRLYRNLGGDKFEDVTDRAGFATLLGKGMGIGIADFNADGWPDIFIANDTERNFLYINQAGRGFEEEGLKWGVAYNDDAATVSAMGVDVRDYDNDGWPDIFYNDLSGQVWALFRNLNGRSFRYASPTARLTALSSPYAGWSAGFIDYNNDGWRDLYSANGDVDSLHDTSEQHDTLFENRDGKLFVDVTAKAGEHFARRGYQRGHAFADLNNDGFTDIVVTSLGRHSAILLNPGNGGHWLDIRLRGTKSNRDGIGARIKVTTGSGRTLYEWVSPSTGFLSSSTLRAHFGLGPETRVAEVEVKWPSGAISRLKDVAIDKLLEIPE